MTIPIWLFIFNIVVWFIAGFCISHFCFKHKKSKNDGELNIDFNQQPPIQLKFGIGLDELITKEHVIFKVRCDDYQWNEIEEPKE